MEQLIHLLAYDPLEWVIFVMNAFQDVLIMHGIVHNIQRVDWFW